MSIIIFFFFSSRRRHTRCALVTGVQTCALPICCWRSIVVWIDAFPPRSCRVARETRCIEARDLGILAFAVEQSSQPPRCDRCAITRGEREGKGQGCFQCELRDLACGTLDGFSAQGEPKIGIAP